jgi:carbon-monoxide dehydrogenase medium subunit
MAIWQHYYLARSIEDALQALSAAQGPARVIAGGTDLLLDLEQGRHPPVDTLVDVSTVPEMGLLELRAGKLFIGAAAPLRCVVQSELVGQHAAALQEAAGLIGGPQVRNTATLGGNVGHALPAADGAISMLALDAQAEVASLVGRRRLPMQALYSGPGRSALSTKEEILVGFHLPLRGEGEGSAFRRVMRPQGVAIAILNMGVWLRRRQETIQAARIAIGPAGPIPFRARAAEQLLAGGTYDSTLLSQVVDAILEEARFRTSAHRSSAEYRRHMSEVLLEDTLGAAWERAALQYEMSR